MNVKDNDIFLVSLNEENKSYKIMRIDWDNRSLGTIYRFDNSNDRGIPNKFINKAFLVSGSLEERSSVYDGETDDEFYEIIDYLKSLPLFEDHKEDIILELEK
jgi:hypothetical protein